MPEGFSPTSPVLLVVDDEALIRWSLKERLMGAGYQVVEAQNGASALRYLHHDGQPVDLALLDLKLPDTDGISLLKEIKSLRPGCRAILMTAFGTPEKTQEALACGAYRVLDKPFDLEEIVRLVDEALESHSSCAPVDPQP